MQLKENPNGQKKIMFPGHQFSNLNTLIITCTNVYMVSLILLLEEKIYTDYRF